MLSSINECSNFTDNLQENENIFFSFEKLKSTFPTDFRMEMMRKRRSKVEMGNFYYCKYLELLTPYVMKYKVKTLKYLAVEHKRTKFKI